jgi:hypothetical protein
MQTKNYPLFTPVDRIYGLDPNIVNLISLFVAMGHSLLNKIKSKYLVENYNKLDFVSNIPQLTFFSKAANSYNLIIKEINDSVYDENFNFLLTYDPDIIFDTYHFILEGFLEGAIKSYYLQDKNGVKALSADILSFTNELLKAIVKIRQELENTSIQSLRVLDEYLEKLSSFIVVLW